jgi:hypothetical protein
MSEIYSATGGGRLSGVYWTWPFLNIRIDESGVRFGLLSKRWALPRASIRRVRRVRAAFFTGIALEHDHPGAPADLVFHAPRRAPFEQALTAAGYAIEGSYAWPGEA